MAEGVPLRVWFEAGLGTGDLAASIVPRGRAVYDSLEEFSAARREAELLALPARRRVRARHVDLQAMWESGRIKVWGRREAESGRREVVQLASAARRRARFWPGRGMLVLPRGKTGPDGRLITARWFGVEIEELTPAVPSKQQPRTVARDIILSELRTFQQRQAGGPADRGTACREVAIMLNTSERAVRAAFRDLPGELRRPSHRPKSLRLK